MSQELMNKVEQTSMKAEAPEFEIGDTVDVHTKILEGEKERTQIFEGVVIRKRRGGASGSGGENGPMRRRCHANR